MARATGWTTIPRQAILEKLKYWRKLAITDTEKLRDKEYAIVIEIAKSIEASSEEDESGESEASPFESVRVPKFCDECDSQKKPS